MKSSRRCTMLDRASATVVSTHNGYFCEPLEPRRLLVAGPPVVVLTESFELGGSTTAASVTPYLWTNPSEVPYDLHDLELGRSNGDRQIKRGQPLGRSNGDSPCLFCPIQLACGLLWYRRQRRLAVLR